MKELSPEIKEMISTPAGRLKLAESMHAAYMANPRRCGGRDYIGGVSYTRFGGRLLTDAEVKTLQERNNGSLKGLGIPYICPECDPTKKSLPDCPTCKGTRRSPEYQALRDKHEATK